VTDFEVAYGAKVRSCGCGSAEALRRSRDRGGTAGALALNHTTILIDRYRTDITAAPDDAACDLRSGVIAVGTPSLKVLGFANFDQRAGWLNGDRTEGWFYKKSLATGKDDREQQN
jgi:hypothetical protein